jgi:lysophospholipase L1-like esterase
MVLILFVLMSAVLGVLIWLRQAKRLDSNTAQKLLAYVVNRDSCYMGFAPHVQMTWLNKEKGLVESVLTDEAGFRWNERVVHPSEPLCRFLAVGDSFVEGSLVEADEAFPARLEAILAERGYSVRVDNGGMRGHTIHQERISALGRWGAADYTGVILGVLGGNDLTDLDRLIRNGCDVSGPVPSAFDLWEVDKDSAFVAAKRLLSRLSGARPFFGFYADHLASRSMDESGCVRLGEEYSKSFFSLVRALKARKQTLLVALFEPFWCDTKSAWSGRSYTVNLLKQAREEGALVADMGTMLLDPSLLLLPVDRHPSSRGHQRIAEAIAKELIEHHALDGCRK